MDCSDFEEMMRFGADVREIRGLLDFWGAGRKVPPARADRTGPISYSFINLGMSQYSRKSYSKLSSFLHDSSNLRRHQIVDNTDEAFRTAAKELYL
jgi:hypothetical protein